MSDTTAETQDKFLTSIKVYKLTKDFDEFGKKGDIFYQLFDIPNGLRIDSEGYIEHNQFMPEPLHLPEDQLLERDYLELYDTIPVQDDDWFQARLEYYETYKKQLGSEIYHVRVQLAKMEESMKDINILLNDIAK